MSRNRLQKKCFIVSLGMHLLLLLVGCFLWFEAMGAIALWWFSGELMAPGAVETASGTYGISQADIDDGVKDNTADVLTKIMKDQDDFLKHRRAAGIVCLDAYREHEKKEEPLPERQRAGPVDLIVRKGPEEPMGVQWADQ